MSLFHTYGDRVQFFVVYIHEAHAIDGRAPMPDKDQPIVEEPKTLEERRVVAKQCCDGMQLHGMPILVDDIDNAVGKAYRAMPDRLYLVSKDGKIAYRGGPGPFQFLPDELEDAIQKELAPKP